tara:strand:+ start:443 stop:1717 length:1275 start_codon:yes stop_codon:yes gene_type:complete
MNNFFKKLFFRSKNLNQISLRFQKIFRETKIKKIFDAVNSNSENSEIRFVGGCVRKIINNDNVDDIDLATNLNPFEVCKVLKKNNIDFYESGIAHGTITAIIDKKKFEITSLRDDLLTDGRHAEVSFSQDWKLDASRRDFTINSIYADQDGNLFDPFNGKKDLEMGKIIFIGDPEKRIKEDYLRVLRYIRFFVGYSKHKHDPKVIKILKKNLNGVSKISSDRLLDELKKLVLLKNFLNITKDKECLEIISLIFPQLKNINIFNKLNNYAKQNIGNKDFIFLICLMIIDGTDNVDYFIYKFNLSNKDKKRILFLNDFFKNYLPSKKLNEKYMNQVFYFNGKESLMDIINFKIFKSKKIDQDLIKTIRIFNDKKIPSMPFGANILMSKFGLKEGRELGKKIKIIEEEWVNNNFQLSEKEVEKIVNA